MNAPQEVPSADNSQEKAKPVFVGSARCLGVKASPRTGVESVLPVDYPALALVTLFSNGGTRVNCVHLLSDKNDVPVCNAENYSRFEHRSPEACPVCLYSNGPREPLQWMDEEDSSDEGVSDDEMPDELTAEQP